MPRVYGYVRPYPGRLGKQVRDFVEEQGFSLGPGMVVAAGATDAYASRWILRATMDLLVLPFHLHRGDGGQILDAIGVLMSLPEDVDLGGLPVLMPVRAFSWGSSFQRRLEILKDSRPHIESQLIVAHQDELDSPTLAVRLRRAHSRPQSTAPLVKSHSMLPGPGAPTSMAPPTVREPAGQWSIPRDDDRDSAAWPVTGPPSGSESTRPASSRPSGTRRTNPPLAFQEDSTQTRVSDPTLSEPAAVSEPAVSEAAVSEPAVSEAAVSEPAISGARAKRSSDSEETRDSLVMPRLSDSSKPESARERFRRAAEIGARVRHEAAERKKIR